MRRCAVVAAMCLLAGVSLATAKPAGVPLDVHDQGRERPAVDHEFYRSDDSVTRLAFPLQVIRKGPMPPMAPRTTTPADLLEIARKVVSGWIFPLGLATPTTLD